MAVFLVNNCKFTGCGLTFPTLGDLIQHIEDTHIDTDPRVLEKQEIQQPAALSLSYILRFFTDAARKEHAELKRKQVTLRTQSPALSVRSVTPTGSEFDDEDMVSDDDSDDSWTTQEEFPTEFILRYSSTNVGNCKDGDVDKPFACPVPGCKKRYKNVNGIKYHARNGHRKESKVKKAFKCACGKSYKTQQGLRNHSVSHHPATELLTLHAQHNQTLTLTKPLTLPSPLVSSGLTLPSTTSSVLSAAIAQQALVPLGASLTPPVTPVPGPTKLTGPSPTGPPVTTTKSPTVTVASVTAASQLAHLAESSAHLAKTRPQTVTLVGAEQS
ncbi:juxtaposed with another zinc finger protein 1-like [Liolophura sinensis]|uniref:juxtaposed with another zinc finger protein 1-like n=1 Tax=Liolophura sinensis TaxID=3198878 RepID=UPI00315924E4